MADLLFARNTNGGFEAGDLVSYHQDGALGPHAHANGKFLLVHLLGVTVEQVADFIEPMLEDYQFPGGADPYNGLRKKRVKNRLRNLDISGITDNEITLTLQEARALLRTKS